MRRLPVSLTHGGFHPKNIGFTADGRVLLIDWCQMGLSPLGSDLATFISLYRLFGRVAEPRDAAFEQQLIAIYHDRMRELTGGEPSMIRGGRYGCGH
jgi:aminoglycoside phosphotransferase (APT) family kinase protein